MNLNYAPGENFVFVETATRITNSLSTEDIKRGTNNTTGMKPQTRPDTTTSTIRTPQTHVQYFYLIIYKVKARVLQRGGGHIKYWGG